MRPAMHNALATYHNSLVMEVKDYEIWHLCDQRTDSGIEIASHHHTFCELIFVLSGELDYEIEGRSYRVRPGDVMFIDKLQFHSGRVLPHKNYERFILWVHPQFVQGIRRRYPDLDALSCFERAASAKFNLLRLPGALVKDIRQNMQGIYDLKNSALSHEKVISDCLITMLLVKFNSYLKDDSFMPAESESLSPDFTEFLHYINANLAEDLSLDSLAERFGVSKFYMAHKFRDIIGQPLHQFILQKRLSFARYQLSIGADPYTAAVDAGFSNYPHFSRTFKRCFGQSPRDYAQSLQSSAAS